MALAPATAVTTASINSSAVQKEPGIWFWTTVNIVANHRQSQLSSTLPLPAMSLRLPLPAVRYAVDTKHFTNRKPAANKNWQNNPYFRFSLFFSLAISVILFFSNEFFSFLSLWRNGLIFFHKVGFHEVFAAIQLGARLNESPCDRNWIGKQLAGRTRQSEKNRLMIKWPVMKTTNELNEPIQWSTAGLDIEVDYALLMGLIQWSRFMQCGHKIGLRFCSTRLRSPLFFCSLPAPQWLNDQRAVCVCDHNGSY